MKGRLIMAEHEQVLFVDYFGNTVQVDAELVDVLNLLREFGVHTDFSCQGNCEPSWDRAYVLSKTRTILPLLRTILNLHRNGAYSLPVKQLVRSFIRSSKRLEFRLFETHSFFANGKIGKSGSHGGDCYYIEFAFSTKYGMRTCIRWPSLETHRILLLLQETKTNIT
jgi:hypothetical protein